MTPPVRVVHVLARANIGGAQGSAIELMTRLDPDRFAVDAGSARPFEVPEYDQRSFDATREALLELARGIGDFQGAFGGRDEVDPVRHRKMRGKKRRGLIP